jgi:hypothetical protein
MSEEIASNTFLLTTLLGIVYLLLFERKTRKEAEKYNRVEEKAKQAYSEHRFGKSIYREGYAITFLGFGVYEVKHQTKGTFKFGHSYLAENTVEEELDKLLGMLNKEK